jgi:hypothetical protein
MNSNFCEHFGGGQTKGAESREVELSFLALEKQLLLMIGGRCGTSVSRETISRNFDYRHYELPFPRQKKPSRQQRRLRRYQ